MKHNSMRGVSIVDDAYTIRYYKNGRSIFVGYLGKAVSNDDRQTAIMYRDCAVYLDPDIPDGPEKFNREHQPTDAEVQSYIKWQEERHAKSEAFNGVTRDPSSSSSPHKAQCKLNGRLYYIGRYATAYEAALAHDLVKRMFYSNNEIPPTNEMLRKLKLNFPNMSITDLEKQVTLPETTLKNMLKEQIHEDFIDPNALFNLDDLEFMPDTGLPMLFSQQSTSPKALQINSSSSSSSSTPPPKRPRTNKLVQ